MARSDLIISLVKASSRGDKDLYRETLEAIISEERSKHHHGLADKLAAFLASPIEAEGVSRNDVSELLYAKEPSIKLDDLYLDTSVKSQIKDLLEEHFRKDLLRSYDLEPRHRILLTGSPGNGKTSVAEAIAESMMVPLYVVRYESVIGSFLGETSQRIKAVIDFVRTRRCVLFFDEFDAVSKERGDAHETGEIKRVVNSLLLQLDSLPSHVTVVAASNHPELLDKAVWRRFQIKMELKKPSPSHIKKWFEDFAKNNKVDFGLTISSLSKSLDGTSYSQLKDFCLDIQRKIVLSQPNADTKKIVGERLKLLGDHKAVTKG